MTLVALTGATGFLGGHIARALAEAGLGVRPVVRDVVRGGPGAVQADLGDEDALTAAFRGADVVVANAALGSWMGTLEDMQRVNVGGVENTMRAAARAGVGRVVLISSTAVLRTRFNTPIAVGDEPYGPARRPFALGDLTTDWRYTLTKCAGEQRAWALARELGVPLVALRPGPIYGSGDTRFTARLLRAHARAVTIAPTVGVPLVHAGDVARTVAVAVTHPEAAGQPWLLAGPPVTYAHVLGRLRELRGTGAFVVPLPLPLRVAYDTRPAEATLGFRARPLDEGLRELLAAT